MEIVEQLMKIGLTRHEAVLYLTLAREGDLTGYEASKISGISRSNAYLALAGLVEKGGAYFIESDVIRYTAVPVKELVANIRRLTEMTLAYIEKNIPAKKEVTESYITITGKKQIIDKMKNIVNQANQRIYASLSLQELEYIKSEVTDAKARGLKVVIITSPPFVMEGITIYHNEKKPGQIHLIADSSYVLTGEISDDHASTCLYSKNKNLVQLIKDSLMNEMKLIEIQQAKQL